MKTRRTPGSADDDKVIVLFAPAAAPRPRPRRRTGLDWYALGVLLLLVSSAVASFHSLAGVSRTLPGVTARPVPLTGRETEAVRRPLLSRPVVESGTATLAPAGRKI